MLRGYPVLLIALLVHVVLPISLHAGRPHHGSAHKNTHPSAATGIQKYGDQRSVGSKDIASLPARLTLDQLYKRWGFSSVGDPPLFAEYHAHADLCFYAIFDLDDIPKIFSGDYDKVKVLRITLAGKGRYESFSFTDVWTSELASPPTKVRADEISKLTDELYLDQIQSRWGKARIDGMPSKATLAFFGNKRDRFRQTASVSYRTPLTGYNYVFFLDRTAAEEFVAGKNTRVKVVSIYLIGPRNEAVLEWGSYINPETGGLYRPAPKSDPFATDTEPRPTGFLGLN